MLPGMILMDYYDTFSPKLLRRPPNSCIQGEGRLLRRPLLPELSWRPQPFVFFLIVLIVLYNLKYTNWFHLKILFRINSGCSSEIISTMTFTHDLPPPKKKTNKKTIGFLNIFPSSKQCHHGTEIWSFWDMLYFLIYINMHI